jgi:hypothetical protein
VRLWRTWYLTRWTGEICVCALTSRRAKTPPYELDSLRFLALGGDADCPVHESGIQLIGAYVTGVLDLYECEVTLPISIVSCWFEEAPKLRRARLRAVSFGGCNMPGLDGAEAVVGGSLYLDQGFSSRGLVQIQYSHIGGTLRCEGRFQNFRKDGRLFALAAMNARIAGDAVFPVGFRAQGQVSLLRAESRASNGYDVDHLMILEIGSVHSRLGMRSGSSAQWVTKKMRG